MDGALLHFPLRYNPNYDSTWHGDAWLLEQRMEQFASEAMRLEEQATDYDDEGQADLADACQTMAANMWREHARIRRTLNDLESGWA